MSAAIWLILRRELGAYFHSMTGYIIAAAVLVVDGILFNAFALGGPEKLFGRGAGAVLLLLQRHHHDRQRVPRRCACWPRRSRPGPWCC